MKERLPAFIAIALLACLVMGTWWAADYTQRSIVIDPPRRVTHEPDSWADKFVMLRTDERGVPVNRIEGDYMQHFPDDDSYEITQTRATGQQPGSPITVGTSDTAIMDQDGERVVMLGNAHVHRPAYQDRPALDVRSDKLIILPDEDIVHTDQPTQVVNGKSTMNGTGMRYDNKTRQLQVFSTTDVKIAGQDAKRTEKQPDVITIQP
jgi:lipopolysaccharide export system protein LptC